MPLLRWPASALNTAWSLAMISLPFAPAAPAAQPPPPGTAPTVYRVPASEAGGVSGHPLCARTELRNFATDPPTLGVVQDRPARPRRRLHRAPARSTPHSLRTRSNHAVRDRRYIRVGMTQAEVVARIGKPDIDAHGQRGKGQRWSYLPRGSDPNTITTVTLVDGRVSDVERKVVR
jgi:hypothetical protein